MPTLNDAHRAGASAFQAHCATCHTIRGTGAAGRPGPDLTHIASRRTIAAARLPRTDSTMAAWISDPQHIKPGVRMPAVPLSGPELIALVGYLAELK